MKWNIAVNLPVKSSKRLYENINIELTFSDYVFSGGLVVWFVPKAVIGLTFRFSRH